MQDSIPSSNNPRVVIVGCGFGGLEVAKNLKNADVQVVMLDRNNYHTFIPLLYQVATAGLEPSSISYPIRKIFKSQRNFHYRMANVQKVNPDKQEVDTDIGSISYDYLVLAHGSKANFFGNQEVQKNCLGLKSTNQALNLRSAILRKFEESLLETDEDRQKALMNFVVVGGGPTGVELSGALGELKNKVLPKDYPELDLSRMNIYLVEGTDRLLPGMSPKSSEKVERYVREFDVHLYKNTLVEDYDGQTVKFRQNGGSTETMEARTLIWAAGVQGRNSEGLDDHAIGKGNRLVVDRQNKVEGYERVYAIGDVALMQTPDYPDGHPQVAPVAMQQGKLLAKNIKNIIQNKPQKAFSYFDKGTMATVGRNRAVAEVGNFKLGGFLAWMAWMAVHLLMLIGFRNRLVVLVDWIWNYFSYDRGIRLILPRSDDLR
jgi:NADH dehydrogenase